MEPSSFYKKQRLYYLYLYALRDAKIFVRPLTTVLNFSKSNITCKQVQNVYQKLFCYSQSLSIAHIAVKSLLLLLHPKLATKMKFDLSKTLPLINFVKSYRKNQEASNTLTAQAINAKRTNLESMVPTKVR